MTDRAPLTSHMHRFTLSQRGDLVKIHLVAEEFGQIPLGHSICYGSEISASQSFGCGAGDYKCSLRIAAGR